MVFYNECSNSPVPDTFPRALWRVLESKLMRPCHLDFPGIRTMRCDLYPYPSGRRHEGHWEHSADQYQK